jgi:hypothetical protein
MKQAYRLVAKVTDTAVEIRRFADKGCHILGSRRFEVRSTQTRGCGYSKIFVILYVGLADATFILWSHRVCKNANVKL